MSLVAGRSTAFKEALGKVLGPGKDETSGCELSELSIIRVIRSDRPSSHKIEVLLWALK